MAYHTILVRGIKRICNWTYKFIWNGFRCFSLFNI